MLEYPLKRRLKLKSMHRFTSTAVAVEEITAMQEGKLGKGLKEFLNKSIVEKGKDKEGLIVVDPKVGASPIVLSRAHACLFLAFSTPN